MEEERMEPVMSCAICSAQRNRNGFWKWERQSGIRHCL